MQTVLLIPPKNWSTMVISRTKIMLFLINDNLGGGPRRQSLFDIVSWQIGRAFQRSNSRTSLSPEHRSPTSPVKPKLIEDDLQRFVICRNERQSVSSSLKSIPRAPSGDTNKISFNTEPQVYERQGSQTSQGRTWRIGSVCIGGE